MSSIYVPGTSSTHDAFYCSLQKIIPSVQITNSALNLIVNLFLYLPYRINEKLNGKLYDPVDIDNLLYDLVPEQFLKNLELYFQNQNCNLSHSSQFSQSFQSQYSPLLPREELKSHFIAKLTLSTIDYVAKIMDYLFLEWINLASCYQKTASKKVLILRYLIESLNTFPELKAILYQPELNYGC